MSSRLRELLILVSFLVITALGVVTVLLPETENRQGDPGQNSSTGTAPPATTPSAHK